jgi:hypothetical protein
MSSRREIGTRGVIRVQGGEHLVAGERRFHGDVSGFVVSNFTDHHDIRILTENGTERVGEAQADVCFHRYLIDARELVLDRVFDRDDVVFRIVQLLEHRIKRRRFTGTGRAGDEDHPMRRIDRFLKMSTCTRPCRACRSEPESAPLSSRR